jgi:Domain of unknown function (DUF4186)
MEEEDELPPLEIKCRSTNCEQGLHCFLRTKRQRKKIAPGTCRACGEYLVDMDRVHQRSIDDVQHTFDALKRELVRHHYWHVKIDQHAVNHARRKGRTGIQVAAVRRLRTSVGRPANPYDGRQTSYTGNVLFYAQHAVAACCRTCIEEWHGIPRDRALTDDELSYFTQLVSMYIDLRLPDLTEGGEHVPSIKRKAAVKAAPADAVVVDDHVAPDEASAHAKPRIEDVSHLPSIAAYLDANASALAEAG